MTQAVSQFELIPPFRLRMGYGIVTFVSCFLYNSLWIWQGIDFTDEGFNLVNQRMIASGLPEYRYGMCWLSDLVGGIWLIATGDSGLLYVRLGGALNAGLIGLATYWILTRHFQPFSVWISTVAAIVLIFYRGTTNITYNDFPALIFIVAAGTILASQDSMRTLSRRMGWGLLSGVLLALTVASRFPLILSTSLLVFPIAVAYLRRKESPRSVWNSAVVGLVAFCAWVTASTIILVYLAHIGRLAEYWQQVTTKPHQAYSISPLMSMYAADAIKASEHAIFLVTFGCVAGVVAETILRRYMPKTRRAFVMGICFVFPLAVGAVLTALVGTDGVRTYYELAMPGLFGLLGFLLILDLLRTRIEPDFLPLMNLLLVALTLPVLLAVGSANGLLNMRFGMSLLVSVVILLLPRRLEEIAVLPSAGISHERLRFYWLTFVSAWVICGFGLRIDQPERDLGNRIRLTVAPDHPLLRHVYTSPERAASINGLLKELEQRARPGDRVLAYDSIPLIHYLTRTIPALGHSWPDQLDPGVLNSRLHLLRTEEHLPVVVRAKVNMRDPAWGVVATTKAWRPSAVNTLTRIDKTLVDLGYREVWQNDEFVILVR